MMCIGDSATRFRRPPSGFNSRALFSPSRSPCGEKTEKKSMPESRRNMSTSDKDLKRLLENLDNHEGRLRRLETQEIGVVTSGMLCLETIELTSDESSVTFSSIDQGFWHLWLWIAAHQVAFSFPIRMYLRFNADSGSNYQWSSIFHNRFDDDSESSTGSDTSDFPTGLSIGRAGSNDSFGYCEANIYNYLNTGNGSFQRGSTWKSWTKAPSIEEIQG